MDVDDELFSFEEMGRIAKTIWGHVQITWTNEGEGVVQMAATLNNSY